MTKFTLVLTNTGISLHHTVGTKFILEFYIDTYLYYKSLFFFFLCSLSEDF